MIHRECIDALNGLRAIAGWRSSSLPLAPRRPMYRRMSPKVSIWNSTKPINLSRVPYTTWNPPNPKRVIRRTSGGIAMGFIFFGLFRFFEGAGLNGLWLAFIGWFLNDASLARLAHPEWES